MDGSEKRPKWSAYVTTYDPLQSGSIDGTDTIPHDRALCRAMEAKFVPPNKSIATPNAAKTLFVGRLDFKTTDEGLKEEFSRYGTITHCRVVRDVVTGFSRGYAFVQFKHQENAELARREAHHVVLEGREILVEWENGRTMPGWIPRRFGGGLGGKKGSGQLRFGGRDRPFRKPIIIKPVKRDGSSNLGEEDVSKDTSEEGIRRPTDEDEQGEERKARINTGSESRGSRSSQLLKENFSKPWNRRNREGWDNSGERESRPSWKGQKNWYKGEDRRYAGKSSREDGSSTRDRRYSSKSSRDRKDCEERGIRYHARSEGRSRRSQDREDASDRKDHYGMEGGSSSNKFPRESAYQQELENKEERSRKSKDQEDLNERDAAYEETRIRKKRSRRSWDLEDRGDLDEFGDVRVKREEDHFGRSLKDRSDVGERKPLECPSSERSDKESTRSRIPSKEEDADFGEDSLTKRSRRDRWDTEMDDDDDGFELKTKKKKKHSKKSSRDSESDDSYERKKEKKKKKKKHKKSRD